MPGLHGKPVIPCDVGAYQAGRETAVHVPRALSVMGVLSAESSYK